MDQRVIRAIELLKEAGRLNLIAAPAAPRVRPVRRAASGVAAVVAACSPPRGRQPTHRTVAETVRDGGAEKEVTAQGPDPLPFLVAETEKGHMTDLNGWEEKKTRKMLIR
ncbi:hypothetical protein NDU88_004841 [Pleurodeles waltl]|uniref:Uncharacterized protein n=1 Tax=Pleurodeles waltl TaxID=8319 RepID=A0AAV7MUM8_PLEWA|nr:hypothetical protein NDU88_004841 [Pleurodeles waltl]